jgi:hypothetical protein
MFLPHFCNTSPYPQFNPLETDSDGLSQQIRQWQLGVLAAPIVSYVLGQERTQSQTIIQLAH